MKSLAYILIAIHISGCMSTSNQNENTVQLEDSLPCLSLPTGSTLELNGKPFPIDSVANLVFDFHLSDEKGYLRLSYTDEASYNTFMTVIDSARQGYKRWRDQIVFDHYKRTYLELTKEEKETVDLEHPYQMKIDALSYNVEC